MNSHKISQIQSQIELRSRAKFQPGMLKETKRPYVKIGKDTKDLLSQLVLKEGLKIVEVAKMLKIKYATAKTTIFHIRKVNQKQKSQETKMIGIECIERKMISKIKVISMTASKIVTVYDHTYSLKEHQSNKTIEVQIDM